MDHRVRIRPMQGQENTVYGSAETSSPVAASNSNESGLEATLDRIRNGIAVNSALASGEAFGSDPSLLNNVVQANSPTRSPSPSAVMAPLRATNGLIFPYTPNIRWGNSNDYQSLGLVHTNSDFSYFIRQEQVKIDISGDFTASNEREAKYLLGAIHFLSSNSKMRFGASDPLRGLPPPTLLLSGYGRFIFNDLPVLIQSWNVDYTNTVDNVEVRYNGQPYAYVPVKTTLSVNLLVQKRPTEWLREFNLDKFRSGDLFLNGKGYR